MPWAIDPTFRTLHLPGDHAQAGFAYGRAIRDLLADAHDPYVADLAAITGVAPHDLAAPAAAWAARLPEHYQDQIDAMADGAGLAPGRVAAFLYADIAVRPSASAAAPPALPGAPELALDASPASGPMCTSLVVAPPHHHGRVWLGRNCDWYACTLRRGTAAVTHAIPGRIPCLTLGITGDLDADTGVNAERLWLHMHTLLVRDGVRSGVSCISWLFWMREALETCATLDDVQRFIQRTDRDRGVILFAVDGKTNESAIFECGRSEHARINRAGGPLIATNHRQAKHPPPMPPGQTRPGRPGGTIMRYDRALELMREAPPEELPHDLGEILADPQIEMRSAAHLRTIYSAVACPATGEIWFASGACPAASQGTWRRVPWPWA